jgi:hypothetical protein
MKSFKARLLQDLELYRRTMAEKGRRMGMTEAQANQWGTEKMRAQELMRAEQLKALQEKRKLARALNKR